MVSSTASSAASAGGEGASSMDGAVSLYSPRRLSSISRRSSTTATANTIATTIVATFLSSDRRSLHQQQRRSSSTSTIRQRGRASSKSTSTSTIGLGGRSTSTHLTRNLLSSSFTLALAGYVFCQLYNNKQQQQQQQQPTYVVDVEEENDNLLSKEGDDKRSSSTLKSAKQMMLKRVQPLVSWIYQFLKRCYPSKQLLNGFYQTLMVVLPSNNNILKRLLKQPSLSWFGSSGPTQNVALSHDHETLIQDIMFYWFGQANPTIQQRTLWMISDPNLRQQVDQHIYEKYFDIVAKLSTLSEYRQLVCNTSRDGHVAVIIALDQLTRHLHRYIKEQHDSDHSNTTNDQVEVVLPSIDVTDGLAKELAQSFQVKYKSDITSGQLPLAQLIFSLMPFRHGGTTIEELESEVLKKIDLAEQVYLEQNSTLLKRFRNATTRRLNLLRDERRRMGYNTSTSTSSRNENVTQPSNNQDNSSEFVAHEDATILETFPFEPSEETMRSATTSHPLVVAVQQFLHDQGVTTSDSSNSTSSNTAGNASTNTVDKHKKKQQQLYTSKKKKKGHNMKQRRQKVEQDESAVDAESTTTVVEQESPTPTAIIVSLSGGVDSMALLHVLSHMTNPQSPLFTYEKLHIFAAHVDYANRPESSQEAAFLQKYCSQLGNVHLKIRRIDEVTRGVTDRDLYEQISRTIRYDMYKEMISKDIPSMIRRSSGSKATNPIQVLGVVLGHHRGDIRENVLSNALKGCGPLELSGMTSQSEIEGVTILRPLLKLEKTSIFNYAHTLGVPYFKDTTPHWSTRGKLRNHLLPLLTEIYGDGCLSNLTNLAMESDMAKQLIVEQVTDKFTQTVRHYPLGLTFEPSDFLQYSFFFWKFVLKETMHGAGRGMWTDKSVQSFLERISSPKTLSGWLQCRKDYAVYFNSDNKRVYVFHPTSFPWSKQDQYSNFTESKGMNYPYETFIKIGPWSIEVERVSVLNDDDEEDALLSQKAIADIDDFIQRTEITYYLKVPVVVGRERHSTSTSSSPSLVLFEPLTKQTRPLGWKNTNVKIESTLPLLTVNKHVKPSSDETPKTTTNVVGMTSTATTTETTITTTTTTTEPSPPTTTIGPATTTTTTGEEASSSSSSSSSSEGEVQGIHSSTPLEEGQDDSHHPSSTATTAENQQEPPRNSTTTGSSGDEDHPSCGLSSDDDWTTASPGTPPRRREPSSTTNTKEEQGPQSEEEEEHLVKITLKLSTSS